MGKLASVLGPTNGVPLPFHDMQKLIIAILVFAVIAAFFLGQGMFEKKTEYIERIIYANNITSAKIVVPAVDENGNGIISTIEVLALPGNGSILADIDKIFFWVDTQQSIRQAKAVAEAVTGINLSRWDIVYRVSADADMVEGPSAGAALAIVTIAALQNKKLNSSVMITGTINEDGKIGPAGGIRQKAIAAKNAGASILLIAKGSMIEGWTKQMTCQRFDGKEYCELDYVPGNQSIEGIEIREIGDIKEALSYFGI